MNYRNNLSEEKTLQVMKPQKFRSEAVGARERLRVLILGEDGIYKHFHSILVANIQNWGYEAVLLPPLSENDPRTWQEMEGDILLYDIDVSLPRLEMGEGHKDLSFTSLGQISADRLWPKIRLLVALSSRSVSRISLERLGAVTLLHKPFDMRHLERYLRVFQRLFYREEEPMDEYASALSTRSRHMRLLHAEEGEEFSAASSAISEERVRVLVADDRQEVTQMVHQCLIGQKNQRYRYDVREAHDGLDLLEQCLGWQPQCIVTDLLMPWLNGYQVMHCLAAGQFQFTPAFVVISALTHHEIPVTRSYLQDRVVLYIDKPFDVGNLLATVEQALAQ